MQDEWDYKIWKETAVFPQSFNTSFFFSFKEGQYLRERGWRTKEELLKTLQLISSVLKSGRWV